MEIIKTQTYTVTAVMRNSSVNKNLCGCEDISMSTVNSGHAGLQPHA